MEVVDVVVEALAADALLDVVIEEGDESAVLLEAKAEVETLDVPVTVFVDIGALEVIVSVKVVDMAMPAEVVLPFTVVVTTAGRVELEVKIDTRVDRAEASLAAAEHAEMVSITLVGGSTGPKEAAES